MRINKPVSLDISILCQSKTVMYEFWYDYVKPKYGENTKLFYMDTESLIVQVKTEDIFKKYFWNTNMRISNVWILLYWIY